MEPTVSQAAELSFQVGEWFGPKDDPQLCTLGALRIEVSFAGGGSTLTEVQDLANNTVRPYVIVPTIDLARWLLANWWRLRCEPERSGFEWRLCHRMPAIGGGSVWPLVEFASDGEFIQVTAASESRADAASVRFLQNVSASVPVVRFERAVDDLVRQVLARLRACGHRDRELEGVWQELNEERNDPRQARECRLQAQAGKHPGDADSKWLAQAEQLEQQLGAAAVDEVMAIFPALGDFTEVSVQLNEILTSEVCVNLGWVESNGAPSGELPWQRGAKLAKSLRRKLGLGASAVLTNEFLSEKLGVELPIKELTAERQLRGAFRQEESSPAPIRISSRHVTGQRFYLSRLIGCALASPPETRFLPVTSAHTALQKVERTFAQEFLCPWEALDAYTDKAGLDDDAISEAAEHFQVSPLTVLSALVNRKKISRRRFLEGRAV